MISMNDCIIAESETSGEGARETTLDGASPGRSETDELDEQSDHRHRKVSAGMDGLMEAFYRLLIHTHNIAFHKKNVSAILDSKNDENCECLR